MTAQHTTIPMVLPDDLPRPQDDGAADHLARLRVASLRLRATDSDAVDLSGLPGRTVVYTYPMTGIPDVELPAGGTTSPRRARLYPADPGVPGPGEYHRRARRRPSARRSCPTGLACPSPS